MPVLIRRFRPGDEETLSRLIRRTLLEINTEDPQEERDWLYNRYTPEYILTMGKTCHTYVVTRDGEIIGTGTIFRSEDYPADECEIKAAFLHPDVIGQGIGAKLFAALETDEIALDSKCIHLTSSIQAQSFYERQNYEYVCGYRGRNSEGLIELAKTLSHGE